MSIWTIGIYFSVDRSWNVKFCLGVVGGYSGEVQVCFKGYHLKKKYSICNKSSCSSIWADKIQRNIIFRKNLVLCYHFIEIILTQISINSSLRFAQKVSWCNIGKRLRSVGIYKLPQIIDKFTPFRQFIFFIGCALLIKSCFVTNVDIEFD